MNLQKNQLLAFALLFAFVEFLDFLTVHHLFGPWAIIIRGNYYSEITYSIFIFVRFDVRFDSFSGDTNALRCRYHIISFSYHFYNIQDSLFT
jgi:hypothetical protein